MSIASESGAWCCDDAGNVLLISPVTKTGDDRNWSRVCHVSIVTLTTKQLLLIIKYRLLTS